MKKSFWSVLYAFVMCLAVLSGCKKEEKGTGFSQLKNPKENKEIAANGESFYLQFTAEDSWTVSVDAEWVRLSVTAGDAGQGKIRLTVKNNTSVDPREFNVTLNVNGFKPYVIGPFKQGGYVDNSSMYEALNKEMDKRLRTDYLWNEEYSNLSNSGSVNLSVDYRDFLYNSLTQLGEVNIEDGGYYRNNEANAGQRFIYSYIEEMSSSSMKAAATKSYSTLGFGFGYMMSAQMSEEDASIGLILGFVDPGSPAEAAGYQRGDVIYKVNGQTLTTSTYRNFWQLVMFGTGTCKIDAYRPSYEYQGNQELLTLTALETKTVTAEYYTYSPVLVTGVYEQGANRIGYIVLESFDNECLDHIDIALEQLGDITDLILDLRFNGGGGVVASRYITSAIAGHANKDKVFANFEFNKTYSGHAAGAGKPDVWTFGSAPAGQGDDAGMAKDMGLKRLYVITSENTASSSELLISSLKGIDFPVYLYGSRTAGKNVGMVVSNITYAGHVFQFAPIMYRSTNAKNDGDYADGFPVDHVVNNQNNSAKDDYDNWFPYGFRDWGLDPAYRWALSNILNNNQDDPFKKNAAAPAVKVLGKTGVQLTPLEELRPEPSLAHRGMVIYE